MSTRLDELKIDEVSGVDSPANDLPGWMVLKSAGEAQAVESQLAVLYAALGGASSLDGAPDEITKAREVLTDTIEKLLMEKDKEPSLVDKMKKFFSGKTEDELEKGKMPPQFKPGYKKGNPDPEDATDDGADEDEEDTSGKKVKKEETPAPPDPEDEVVKAKDFEVLKDALSAVVDRLENIEDVLVGPASIQGQDDSVSKSKPTLRDGIISAAQGNRVVIS